MKKIQKVNHTSAQSVYSFYCPCSGICLPECGCVGCVHTKLVPQGYQLAQYNPQATTTT